MIDAKPLLDAKPLPAGYFWCDGCQAAREDWHRHGDPLEEKTHGELLELVRDLQENQQPARDRGGDLP